MSIDFSRIRTYEGSQQGGFEELICQLAHLEGPPQGEAFVRKKGDGGDAGVECYWILDDNSELAWQAKFFPEGLNPSRWQQIDDSVSKALRRHPNIREYHICLPLDKTDSRKTGKSGAKVISVEDEWQQHVQKWQAAAQALGRTIDYHFWGKHEIETRLTIDDPMYSGRRLYWFDEPFLSIESLKRIAVRSQESLGERYTPELNVDLPIARRFDGLCMNKEWWTSVDNHRSGFAQATFAVLSFLKKEAEGGTPGIRAEYISSLEGPLRNIVEELAKGHELQDFNTRLPRIRQLAWSASNLFSEISHLAHSKDDWQQKEANPRQILSRLSEELDNLCTFLEGQRTLLSTTRAALLLGEAGIGKSHLLCDLSLNRIQQNLPTLFMLGSQYLGGNPVDSVKDALDLGGHANAQVLGALDAAGEASGARVLIVIDAINEGMYRDEWIERLSEFLSDLKPFLNIAVLLSCRSTFSNYLIPESVDEVRLPRLIHPGFRGFEHRAAEMYLSKQGITKPSAPILTPEFTNPLFLKTCCRALRENGQTAFPKGANSFTLLFDFYVQSIERVIARKKRCNAAERTVTRALDLIVSLLFPDDLSGVPVQKARFLVNQLDPQPNLDQPLFQLLLDEGILSEEPIVRDRATSEVVVRFAYERFSDFFIAQYLIESLEDIESAFQPGGAINALLGEKGFFKTAGILEALAIIIPERFNRELADLLSADEEAPNWILAETFQNSVVFRSAASISARTLELLNSLESNFRSDPKWQILLRLSTEPKHPWNAEFLHSSLIEKEIAERDHLWSTWIAFGNSSEEDDEDESIVRSIIEWSHSADISNAEEERIRLCAITLIWFFTTPNRKVRDRATKAAVRILTFFPNLVKPLIERFLTVNDTYLTERVFAVAYGVVCNTSATNAIREIALATYDSVFRNSTVVPHLLLRDYARGILEWATAEGIMGTDVDPVRFRPPFNSNAEIDNPTIEEVNRIAGEDHSSAIKSSLMGFPGDFGNYTMGCIHHWSSTHISTPTIQSGFELKQRFAEETLSGKIKEEFIEFLGKETADNTIALANLGDLSDKSQVGLIFRRSEEMRKELEALAEKVNSQLDVDQKEYFRWLNGVSEDGPAAFSRKWAQRWVCKRAYEFGWSEERFSDFERFCSHGRGGGRSGGAMERVGKKYQWMALYEFLARLSDNYHWIRREWAHPSEADVYQGPWQIHKRDIDPTIWTRENGEYNTYYNKTQTWWQPFQFSFPTGNEESARQDFLWDKEAVPKFDEMIEVTKPGDCSKWLVLHGFFMQKMEYPQGPYLDGWFRINSILLRKTDLNRVETAIHRTNLCDPFLASPPSTQHQGFLGEYPWHPIYEDVSSWRDGRDTVGNPINVQHLIPYANYEWEDAGYDYSLNSSLSLFLPAPELVRDLNLSRPAGQWGIWERDGKPAFCDPSVTEYGPSYALIEREIMVDYLNENDMTIAWLIGGEKGMFSSEPDGFHGSLVFGGFFGIEDGSPTGELWFDKKKPRTKN